MSIWTIIGALWIWKMCEKLDAADDRRELERRRKVDEESVRKSVAAVKPISKIEPTQTVLYYQAGKWVEPSIYAK